MDAESLLDSLSPAAMGDALMGLLALGREVLAGEDDFLKSLDRRIQNLASPDFTLAMPSLRAAFGWLPSSERKKLARVLAGIHRGVSAAGLTHKLAAPPEVIARAMEAERRAVAELARWGIFMRDDHDERS